MSVRCALSCAVLGLLLPAAPARAARVDYSGWQALLDRYLVVTSAKGQPVDTRFDYEQLYVDDGFWRLRKSRTLDAVHEQLFAVPPAELGPAERRAWAVNAYNFLVVERMTTNLLVPGRQFLRYAMPSEIRGEQGGFWDARCVTLEGHEYSLQEFERRYVWNDTSAAILPSRHEDPRVQFALCRGRIGDPPLAKRAFRPDSLEHQLDEQVRRVLALERFLSVDPDTRRIWCGFALQPVMDDLGGMPGLWDFVEARAPGAMRKAMRKQPNKVLGGFTPIDERMNQFDRRHPIDAVLSGQGATGS